MKVLNYIIITINNDVPDAFRCMNDLFISEVRLG